MKSLFFRSRLGRFLFGSMTAIAAIWIAAFILVASQKEHRYAHRAEETQRLAHMFANHVYHVFKSVDSYIKLVRREYRDHDDINGVRAFLDDVPLDSSIIAHISIVSEAGVSRRLSGSGRQLTISVKDREYFRKAKDLEGDQLYISSLYEERGNGESTIYLVRPIIKINGEFGGAIVAAIANSNIISHFDIMKFSAEDSVIMVGTDKRMLARSNHQIPASVSFIKDLKLWAELEQNPHGLLSQISDIDGVSRYYAYRKLSKYPFVVMTWGSINQIEEHLFLFKLLTYGIPVFLSLSLGFLFTLARREIRASEALRLNEERFRNFAEATSDWFWEMDENLRFTYFSERNRKVTGLDPSSFIGKTRREITAESAIDEKWRQHLDDLDNHRPIRDFTYDLMNAAGQYIVIQINGQAMFGPDGEFMGYRGTGADFTEQKRAEGARDQALREAEQANSSKSKFLANMSHELRTPLNSIIGFTSALLSGVFGKIENEKQREYLGNVQYSGEYLLELINDILDISKIEAGEVNLDKAEIDLRGLALSCVGMLKDRATDAGIRIEVDIPAGFPRIEADQRHVTQVFLNLLSNSIKFTPRGGDILVHGEISSDQHIVLSISDTGIGIAAVDISEILKPFGQVAGAMTRNHEGTGLGLPIAKSLIELNGGSFLLESEAGEGTVATIRFPLQPVV